MSPWQFTILRVGFGLFLAGFFTLGPALPGAIAWPSGVMLALRIALAAVALVFAAGVARRPTAALLGLAWGLGVLPAALPEHPLWLAPALLLGGALLAPAGEPVSRGPRQDSWTLPPRLFHLAWLGLVVIAAWDGFLRLRQLDSGNVVWLEGIVAVLELAFGPAVLVPKIRPWAWLILAALNLVLLPESPWARLGMLMLHLFTFDPGWLRPVAGRSSGLLLAFDGDCMICSRAVRFFVAEDRAGLLRFVKLQSRLGREMEATAGAGLLQTMVVKVDGQVFHRSAGVLRALEALGGHWRALAIAGRVVPRALADGLYRFIAARRYRWFGRADACALPSPELRARLIDGDAL